MSHNVLKMKRLIKINKIIPKFIKIIPNSHHIVINERKSVKAYMFSSCHMIYSTHNYQYIKPRAINVHF